MINRYEIATKVSIEDKFPCAVCRKRVDSKSILCEFCKCWVHKRCSGIGGKLGEDSKSKCHKYANHFQLYNNS